MRFYAPEKHFLGSLVGLGLDRVAQHHFVPKHEIVPLERIKEVLEKYGSSFEKFPKILRDDTAVIEIGAKKGDLIRITRHSPTAGKAIYYRVVE